MKGQWICFMKLIKSIKMSFIIDLKKHINNVAEISGVERNTLIEKKVKPFTKVQLQTERVYLLYDFERLKDPFPFFEKTEDTKGLNAIADYVIFTENKDKLWAVIIELKNGKGNPKNQIFATKQFASYLIESINRQCKKEYKVEIRGIAYSKLYRPTTNLKKPYDKYNNTYISGNKLNLTNFLI